MKTTNRAKKGLFTIARLTFIAGIAFSVSCSRTVKPLLNNNSLAPVSAGNLACSIIAPTGTLQVGQTQSFSLSLSGGTAPYSYSMFSAGTNGTVLSNPAAIGAYSGVASASYSAAGSPTVTLTVTDAAFSTASCTAGLTITDPAAEILPVKFFRRTTDAGGYYSNGVGQYCVFQSMDDWIGAHGPDFATVDVLSSIPSGMQFAGACAHQDPASDPLSFFRSGNSFYVVTGGKLYCQFTSNAQWVRYGGGDGNAVPNYTQIPSTMISDGQCPIKEGFFIAAGMLFHADAARKFCMIQNPAQWAAMGAQPADSAGDFTPIPTSMTPAGECPIPTGFFRTSGGLYFANSVGQYCSFTSLPEYQAWGGPIPYTNAAEYSHASAGMVDVGNCWLPQGFFKVKGIGYFSNATGHFCSLWQTGKWAAAGAPNINSVPDFDPVPNSMTYDGECGATSASLVIYRSRRALNSDYLYSTNSAEGGTIYKLEGPAFAVYPGQVAGTVGMYRCKITVSANKRDTRYFLSPLSDCGGYTVDGLLGYMFPYQASGSLPLYRLRNPKNKSYLTTLYEPEKIAAIGMGWTLEGIIGYGFGF